LCVTSASREKAQVPVTSVHSVNATHLSTVLIDEHSVGFMYEVSDHCQALQFKADFAARCFSSSCHIMVLFISFSHDLMTINAACQ
jgi:hypothetical protein